MPDTARHLNSLAGTTDKERQGAAQVLGTAPGMELVGALNKYLGTTGKELAYCLRAVTGKEG